ncbi:leucine--tRNA ligase [Synechococcus sp. RSCCF101]|uniref:leucine--tRNA ligase n=1 Tax=Synechococcus sp. RSCCF101 TaxID=2511069 RepID=UPI0012475074|nr:leucine--tRNA ligase [Synechococcus sp. RSCCF101]QEY31712.1 leucine--tRNA ligase [Synechococcus sp. RSCCF101]
MTDRSPASQTSRYEPARIEPLWQQRWQEQGLDATPDPAGPSDVQGEPFYALSMFPYPSGSLHMGHVRNYVITDVIARTRRLQGRRVLHPMGWDAFGLPAENAAIERGVDPTTWTDTNIAQMRGQLQRLGLSIDWSREEATCRPDYYRWTQWLFLQFLDAGLAYRREATVNWDPVDQTVLANEQVDSEGRSWRSGALVEQRQLRQWFLRITDYAEPLLQDLEQLSGWPERVRTMQANWIGRSVGAEVSFPCPAAAQPITVFTTRPDTLFGATYLVLAPDHPLVEGLTSPDRRDAVAAFVAEVARESEQERTAEHRPKRGVPLGATALHPLTREALPVWIADYVLREYGTGAVMGVPAHDERDHAFAGLHGLPAPVVIRPPESDSSAAGATGPAAEAGQAYTQPGILCGSGRFDGLASEEAKSAIVAALEERGAGRQRITYRLRDWLISRQRYWGCPIPVVHCPSCGVVPVPEDQLPVLLPSGVPLSGRGGSPLAQDSEWLETTCPTCGGPAHRETDTMDTFMCSSWYFLRFCDAGNDRRPFDREAVDRWMPVDQYVGGIEHAILHLLYARFFTKVLRDRGLIGVTEPFRRLLTQGMVQGLTYRSPSSGRYVASPSQGPDGEPQDPDTGETLEVVFEKMSKSKGNGVDPAGVIDRFGADTARMFILFKAPPEKDLEWDDADVEGQHRFLLRLWRLIAQAAEAGLSLPAGPLPAGEGLSPDERELRRAVHAAIAAISEDLGDQLQLNTAIAELMKLSNALAPALEPRSEALSPAVLEEALEALLLMLSPFAPHLAEELWQRLGGVGSVHRQRWPVLDPTALTRDTLDLVIQVKGKVRGSVQVPAGADRSELERLALASEVARRWLGDAAPRRVIVVPGKLVNLVP